MKLISIALLFFYISTTTSNLLNLLSVFSKSTKSNDTGFPIKANVRTGGTRYFQPTIDIAGDNDLENKYGASLNARRFEDNFNDVSDISSPKLVVPFGISNEDIERRAQNVTGFRRFNRDELNKNWIHSRSIGLTSTSTEEKNWKKEYKEKWLLRKQDAMKDPVAKQPHGHIVNMVAARPWRVPCGEEEHRNILAGACTLPLECPPELRVFKGDHHCGRSSFVCCRLQILENDFYEAFDPTFGETSEFSTSSEELREAKERSRERRGRKRQRKRNRTLKTRYRRKRFIKKTIRKLAKEVRKELNRAFRNSTENRRHVIRNLKILIKKMKAKFREERHKAKFQHDADLANINFNLGAKLKKIRALNFNFLTNDTFREIVINGTAGRAGPKLLFEEYPELNSDYSEVAPVVGNTRRSGRRMVAERKHKKRHARKRDYLEYDIEFGMLA